MSSFPSSFPFLVVSSYLFSTMLEASCVKPRFSDLAASERRAGQAVSWRTRRGRAQKKRPGLYAPGPSLSVFSCLTLSKSLCFSFIHISERREWTKMFPKVSSSSETQAPSYLNIRKGWKYMQSKTTEPHSTLTFPIAFLPGILIREQVGYSIALTFIKKKLLFRCLWYKISYRCCLLPQRSLYVKCGVY